MTSKHLLLAFIVVIGMSSVGSMTPNFMGKLSNKLGIVDFFNNLFRGVRKTLFFPFIEEETSQIEMKHQQSNLYPFYKKLTSKYPFPNYQLKTTPDRSTISSTSTTEIPTLFYYYPSTQQIKTPRPNKQEIIYPHYFQRPTTTLTTIFTTTVTTTKKPERIISLKPQPKTHVEVTYSDIGLFVMRAPNLIPLNQNNLKKKEQKLKEEKLPYSTTNLYDETTLLPQTLRPSFNNKIISNFKYDRQYNKSYEKTTLDPNYLSELKDDLIMTTTTLPVFLRENRNETTDPINYFPFELTTPGFVEDKKGAQINYLRPISTTSLPTSQNFITTTLRPFFMNKNELRNNLSTTKLKTESSSNINDVNIGEHFQFFHSPDDNSFGFSNLDGNPGRSFFYHKRLNQMEFAVAETLNNAYTQDFVILSTENPEPILKVGYIYREMGDRINSKFDEKNTNKNSNAVFNPSDFEFLNNN